MKAPDDTSQIEEYLREYKGEGIQHIAVGTARASTPRPTLSQRTALNSCPARRNLLRQSQKRVKGHREPIERMKRMAS